MAERKKIIHEKGKYFDVTPMHGRFVNINMFNNDVGYAQVGIISSGRNYILFQFRNRLGLASKMYVENVEEVKMTPRKMKKQKEIIVRDWDEEKNPFELFLGHKCDIHVHSTNPFEGNPGFFAARILDVGDNYIQIRENSRYFNVSQYSICAMLEVADD